MHKVSSIKAWLFSEVDIIEMQQADAHVSRAEMPALPGEEFALPSPNRGGRGWLMAGVVAA
jgi:hypothetical protein